MKLVIFGDHQDSINSKYLYCVRLYYISLGPSFCSIINALRQACSIPPLIAAVNSHNLRGRVYNRENYCSYRLRHRLNDCGNCS